MSHQSIPSADITLVLDRSGSIASIVDSVIRGVNQFLDEQAKLPGRATITLVQFDDQYEAHWKCHPDCRGGPSGPQHAGPTRWDGSAGSSRSSHRGHFVSTGHAHAREPPAEGDLCRLHGRIRELEPTLQPARHRPDDSEPAGGAWLGGPLPRCQSGRHPFSG